MTDWKYIWASAVGTSHSRTGAPCQDRSGCRVFTAGDGTRVLVAVASDGAGSAIRSEEGSSLACSLFLGEMETLFGNEGEGDVRQVSREFLEGWLTSFRREVDLRAEHEGLAARDFACTFLAAVVGEDCASFAQIGDGAIVVPDPDEPGEYNYVFWPEQGEYANQTYFATEDGAASRLQYDLIPHRVEEVAVLTDGLQNLALHLQSRTAHTPFFRPIFAWLRPAPDDYSEKFTASLSGYLNSPAVNDCTDDDKTLVLATRKPASNPVITEVEPACPPQEDVPTTLQ
jgi:hypothetical protein